MKYIVEFIESDLFANLCQLFSALGTVGAVIVSLYIIFKQNKIKVKLTATTIDLLSERINKYISGFSVTICNLSSTQNIFLKQSLYMKKDKKDEKGNDLLLFVPVPKIIELFPFKSVISPGEEYTFFLAKKQIKCALEESKSKLLKFYFMDKFNKKYSIKVKRSDLEKRLKYIEENKNKIIEL